MYRRNGRKDAYVIVEKLYDRSVKAREATASRVFYFRFSAQFLRIPSFHESPSLDVATTQRRMRDRGIVVGLLIDA